jgi:DNA-binding response OmpR family regulator
MLPTRGIMLDPDCEFLAKPFTPSALKMKVREVLDRARTMGQGS